MKTTFTAGCPFSVYSERAEEGGEEHGDRQGRGESGQVAVGARAGGWRSGVPPPLHHPQQRRICV